MKELVRKHHISIKNAISGLNWAISTQPNFKVHLVLSLTAILAGLYVSLSQIEWAVIVLTIVFGLGGEMINTAIESITDLVTMEWKQDAKIAKDVSAAMMLVIAIGAVIVASIILLPKILFKINIF